MSRINIIWVYLYPSGLIIFVLLDAIIDEYAPKNSQTDSLGIPFASLFMMFTNLLLLMG